MTAAVQHTVTRSAMRAELANDTRGACVSSMRAALTWQMSLEPGPALAADQGRHGCHVDALQAAHDVLPRLRRLAMASRLNPNVSREAAQAWSPEAITTRALLEIGWLAWEFGCEPQALRILGGVGGFIGGPAGRAMLQASAWMKADRLQEASDVLHEAVRTHGDPVGEASATLAMLWRAMGNPAWVSTARRVADSALDEDARKKCLAALKSDTECSIGSVPQAPWNRQLIH